MKNETNNYVPDSAKLKQQPVKESSNLDLSKIQQMIEAAVEKALQKNGMIVESVEKILADEEVFFIRGGVVVSLYKDAFSSDLEVRTASHNSLLRALSCISTWLRWKKEKFEIFGGNISGNPNHWSRLFTVSSLLIFN